MLGTWGYILWNLEISKAPSLISLMVSVDVKHHVYLTAKPMGVYLFQRIGRIEKKMES